MKSSRSDTSSGLSRLDAIKLELAVVVGLLVGVLIGVWRVEMSHWADLGLLALAGFAAGGWIAWRTRGMLRDDRHGS
jgi:F0F1-type ATP synthase assembly protein I